jgi:hypothetical protein
MFPLGDLLALKTSAALIFDLLVAASIIFLYAFFHFVPNRFLHRIDKRPDHALLALPRGNSCKEGEPQNQPHW